MEQEQSSQRGDRETNSIAALFTALPYPAQLFLFYALAHGGILLFPNAIFWDDWTLWNHPYQDILSTFEQAGSFLNLTGYLHVALLSVGPWAYALLTFVLTFASTMLLNAILARHKIFSKEIRFLLLLLFLTTPLYAARVSIIMLPSTFSVFLFIVGWWLIDKQRFLSLAFFMLSFNVQSLLVFYALPILEWYFRTHQHIHILKGIRWAIARLDYFLLPFIWLALKTLFFAPFGFYANYNSAYSLDRFLSVPSRQLDDLLQQSLNLPIFALCLGLSFFALRKLNGPKITPKQSFVLVLLSLFALILALFPYWVLGHVPTFKEWTSRHQLLMPFGISLVIVSMLMLLSHKLRIVFSMLLLAIFLSKNIETYWMFWKDAKKQEQVIAFLKDSDLKNSTRLIIFDDTTENAIERRYRFYEWNGMMRHALGTQANFGINPSQLKRYEKGRLDRFFTDKYNAADHKRTDMIKHIVISIESGTDGYKIRANTP